MKAIQSKPHHIEVPAKFLTTVREAMAMGAKLPAGTRYDLCHQLKVLEDGGYDYEVQPVKRDERDTVNVVACEERDAEMWSVYRRPRIADKEGMRLAEWVADCKLRPHAESLRESLQALESRLTGV